MSVLDIETLKVEFPGRRGAFAAVDGVSLTLAAGEILGLVGESGAGKSTVGNAVIGLLDPPGHVADGSISLSGTRIDALPERDWKALRGRRIGMIFQDPLTSLDPLQTVGDQLVETIRVHLPLSRPEARARAIELLEAVGIADPETRFAQYPHQFSGGMRQRVVIALALSADPELIIADEPTTALDVSIQAQILDLLKGLCQSRRMAMLVITHDMGVIAEITDRVAVMYRGRLVEEGPTEKVLGQPQHAYTQSLISAVPRPDVTVSRFASVGYIEAERAPQRKIDLATHWLGAARAYPPVDGPLLRLDAVSMRFAARSRLFAGKGPEISALKGVSFSVAQGESYGLVGESGSGKSTVARIICGLHRPSEGSVHFAGKDLLAPASRSEALSLRRQMQMIFQDPYSSLNGRMRVRDIIAEPIRFHRLAGSAAETDRIVEDLLDHVGLGSAAGMKFPHEFSGGQRQRISIARALASRPRFLICDEPTSALDVSIQAQILNLLKDLQQELGLTLLFISHNLAVIRQMCDRVGVMRSGELCEEGETAQIFSAPRHAYTRQLLEMIPSMSMLAPPSSATFAE